MSKVASILLVVLVVMLLLSLLGGPYIYPAHWGYYPTGGFGLLLIIVLVLVLLGRL